MTKKKSAAPIVSFSTESQEDPNEGVIFDYGPVRCICPHCERAIVTFTDHETSWVTWALGFLVWLSLGWMAFWVLPVLWPAFKDVVHHCPRCLNVIATKSRISLPTFKTEVMTVKVGSCAVVLARKYVVCFLAFVSVIFLCYLFRGTIPNARHNIPRGKDSPLTWEDFMADCGPPQPTSGKTHHLGFRAASLKNFEKKYLRKTFKWQGEVRQIREGVDIFLWHTKSILLVKMYPTRYPLHDYPDIALLFGDERNKDVANFSPGDWIEFEATMSAHGRRGEPEVMTLWGARAAERPPNATAAPTATLHVTGLSGMMGMMDAGHKRGVVLDLQTGRMMGFKDKPMPPGVAQAGMHATGAAKAVQAANASSVASLSSTNKTGLPTLLPRLPSGASDSLHNI